jgi:hypothetical protein
VPVEVSLLIFGLRLEKTDRLISTDRKADHISGLIPKPKKKIAILDNQVLSTTPERINYHALKKRRHKEKVFR